MASTYLTRTFTSGNRKTFTISVWFKLGNPSIGSSDYENIIAASGGDHGIWIRGDQNELDFYFDANLVGTTSIRDVNAWYHLVVGVDTTQATDTNRVKIYLNGEQFTSLDDGAGGSVTYPSLNADTLFNNNGGTCTIGKRASTDVHYWTGSMSHFHFCDGTQYAASDFGSTDATTGEWKINIAPSVTYGNNGFFILKDGNSGTDQSGNGNNFTVGGGTLTKTEDCPSNVFATINPLFVNDDGDVNALTKGNNTYTSAHTSEWHNMASTLGAVTGKYYWEVKYEQLIDTSTIYMSSEGVASDLAPANHNLGEGTRSGYGYGWLCANRNTTSNTRYLKTVAGTSTLTTDSNNTPVVAGDIVGVAWDADNGKLWFHKNGTYIDDTSGYVGNPTTGAYPYHTGMQTGILYTVWSDVWQNSTGSDLIKSYNFGNGYFGTTAVSSAGTNASGIGIFEYDVPTGFTALSTKGLNE